MALIQLPPLIPTASLAVVLYAIYYIHWQLTVGRSRRALIALHGCQTLNTFPDRDPTGFGYFTFRESIRWFREHKLMSGVQTRFEKMGVNTYRFKAVGREIYTTIEPENLKTIQSLDSKNWGLGTNRKNLFIPFLGHGIFTTDGKEWAHSREMLRPNFVRSQIGDTKAFEPHVQDLIDAIPRDGSFTDLQDLFFRLTIDSATEFLFGESTNCLKPGLSTVSASRFASAFTGCQEAISQAARFGVAGSMALRKKQFKEDCKFVHEFVDHFVDRGLAQRDMIKANPEPDGRYVFLNELICQTDSHYQIRSELLNILLAGRDTTASLLSNVWLTLSQRPDIYDSLRKEVDDLNGEKPGFERIKEMKYLRALLNESLRLYPVVPANSRQAQADCVLPMGGGKDGKSPIFIRKGQLMAWNVYVMHRRKDFYGEDAEEFRPERWLGKDGLRPGWEYLPFNGGPRICLGQQFALTEASYTTIRLMQEFKGIKPLNMEPWKEWLTFTCTGFGGCNVSFTPV